MTPFVQDVDFTLYCGEALTVLRELPSESVNCAVTSPPYWCLRDYGTDGQLGLEATPDAYVAALIAVFAELRRVLTGDGTLWLNLGDSYATDGGRGAARMAELGRPSEGALNPVAARGSAPGLKVGSGLKEKDLCGIPWRVAFALQADGWYLRSDIVWSKPNPMPESVTDRPTKSHEYVFLLSKSPRYFYDAVMLREDATWERWGGQTTKKYNGHGTSKAEMVQRRSKGEIADRFDTSTRNGRSVWEIATQPYADAHFATFPEELVRRCVLAGCPPGGTVLDPFMGSGTTALVARRLGRRSIGIELNADYCEMAARRLGQQSLLAEAPA